MLLWLKGQAGHGLERGAKRADLKMLGIAGACVATRDST